VSCCTHSSCTGLSVGEARDPEWVKAGLPTLACSLLLHAIPAATVRARCPCTLDVIARGVYIHRLHNVCLSLPRSAVLKQYVKVLHMLSPPSTFFSPFIMARAAWYAVLLPCLARQPLVHPWLTEGQAGNLGPEAKHTSTDEGKQCQAIAIGMHCCTLWTHQGRAGASPAIL
jgi:hypothetical protein